MIDWNYWKDECHKTAVEKGWWENSLTEEQIFVNFINNLHGEVSELWEAYRNGKLDDPCDKDCGLTCYQEEVADVFIRTLDYCGHERLTLKSYDSDSFLLPGYVDTPILVAKFHEYIHSMTKSVLPDYGLILDSMRMYLNEDKDSVGDWIRIKNEYNKTRTYRHGGKKA